MIDPLKELDAALQVSPSPEFAARVRMQVDAEATSGSWRVTRWLPIAIGAAIVAIVVAFTLDRSHQDSAVPAPAARVATSAPVPAAPVSSAPRVPVAVTPAQSPRVLVKPAEPEVLVARDQVAGLQQLMARLRDGTLDSSNVPLTWKERVQGDLQRPGLSPVSFEIPGAVRLNELARYGG